MILKIYFFAKNDVITNDPFLTSNEYLFDKAFYLNNSTSCNSLIVISRIKNENPSIPGSYFDKIKYLPNYANNLIYYTISGANLQFIIEKIDNIEKDALKKIDVQLYKTNQSLDSSLKITLFNNLEESIISEFDINHIISKPDINNFIFNQNNISSFISYLSFISNTNNSDSTNLNDLLKYKDFLSKWGENIKQYF
jgi:hypothetical protein